MSGSVGVATVSPTPPVVEPSFGEVVSTFARIGCLSFGGPAGQIALMHRVLVDEKRWVDEESYLGALNFCMLLPGPEAMQLATWVGWKLHGVRGGLAAGLLFVLPGALVMLVLSALYAAFGAVPLVTALFLGIKAAVLAIVVEALMRVAKRALKGRLDWMIAGAAFVGIYFLGVAFPVIVIAAALFGFFRGGSGDRAGVRPAGVPLLQTARTAAIWLGVWLVPLIVLALVAGRDHVLTELAWLFSKLAVVTFGGAYAVLAYMGQEVVQQYGWLTPGEMLDGLGLAETTPGPLILVLQFVGFLAALRQGGEPAAAMAVAGAAVTLWATFAPCFLWIFTGAPYLAQVSAEPRLKRALAAVTAAVVGVILNLTVWFSVNVLFARVGESRYGPIHVMLPDPTSLHLPAAGLAALAFILLFVAHRGIVTTLAAASVAGLALHYLGAV
ncbi:MAG: chromate efflux transporter [Hyphomicrobiaceae bacterium]